MSKEMLKVFILVGLKLGRPFFKEYGKVENSRNILYIPTLGMRET